jgi:hypothetical protein
MWYVLDTSKIVQTLESLAVTSVSIADIPSNMEILEHNPNNMTIQAKFYYYTGKHEKTETKVLQGAVAELGIGSRRLFSITGRSLPIIQSGVRELILGASTDRAENCFRACLVALQVAIPKPTTSLYMNHSDISAGQQLEKLLQSLEPATLEELSAVLESASVLGFNTVEQVLAVVKLFSNSKNNL